jgi:hypothetical protein
MEPNCQSCHTGTATSNNGKIRFTTCFEANGSVRVAANQTFATQPNTPAANLSLYRFSTGHGGLQCSACHGSTHAEFPSTHRNDNLRNERIQGHAGVMVECTACHVSMAINASTAVGGPHGMHPVGVAWANSHGDLIEDNSALRATCANCHGADGTGTVLSRMQQSRTMRGKNYWRGQAVSCYDCHNGPGGEGSSSHPPAVAQNISTTTLSIAPVAMTLQASGGGTLTYRIVSQPAHGSVGLSGGVATYFAEAGYVGTDQFTFAVGNGWVDSNLATGTVAVAQAPAGLVWHKTFGWLFEAGNGWFHADGFGWMWFDSGGQWIWSTSLQGWIAITDPNSRMLWSTQFRWLTPSATDVYQADTTAIGPVYVGKYNGAAIPDSWVVSDHFGYVWAVGDGVWFYSERYGWLGVTPEGGIWSVNQGRFL